MCNCGGGKRRFYERRYGKRKPKQSPPPIETENQVDSVIEELPSEDASKTDSDGIEAND
jgi:hypothetical protein